MPSFENLCLNNSLSCSAIYMAAEACMYTFPANIITRGFLNVSLDTSSDWVFTPPGETCADSYVIQDGIRSNFSYVDNVCTTSFSDTIADISQYVYIEIANIGQEVIISRKPFVNIAPLEIEATTYTITAGVLTVSVDLTPRERCFDLPSTFMDIQNDTWAIISEMRNGCSRLARARYATSHLVVDSDKSGIANGYQLYEFAYGGDSSTCGTRTPCIDTATVHFSIALPKEIIKNRDALNVLLSIVLGCWIPSMFLAILALVWTN